jgi:hypothetical protein
MNNNSDFRIIKPYKIQPNEYFKEVCFQIPIRVLKLQKENAKGNKVPIIIERLDFFTGEMKKSEGFTYAKVLELFENKLKDGPFETIGRAIVTYKGIGFMAWGTYSVAVDEILSGLVQELDTEEKIMKVYHENYQEIRAWIGELYTNTYDLK